MATILATKRVQEIGLKESKLHPRKCEQIFRRRQGKAAHVLRPRTQVVLVVSSVIGHDNIIKLIFVKTEGAHHLGS